MLADPVPAGAAGASMEASAGAAGASMEASAGAAGASVEASADAAGASVEASAGAAGASVEASAGKTVTGGGSGSASEDRSGDASAQLREIAGILAQGTGPVYTWQDGDSTRRVRLVADLVVQPSASNAADDSIVVTNGSRSVVRRQPQHGNDAEPVFQSESGGGLMTLPGGVLLALDAGWDQSRVDRFFSDNGIKDSRVTQQEFAENAFLVDTDPGFASLDLAAALAPQEGVLISAPNWQQEAALK